MSDSSSFTSLLDLVESHLSKCNVQESASDNTKSTPSKSIPMPSLNGIQNVLSDTCLISPGGTIPLPKYGISDSPIQNVLAEQISNMLKARERKEQEERQRLEEEMKKLALQEEKDDEYIIDLVAVLQTPVAIPKTDETAISRSSSFESFLIDNIKQFDEFSESSEIEELVEQEKLPTLLSSPTYISNILNQKVNKVKCSPFGKVLTARLRPVAAPYLKVHIQPHRIVRFDFNTKSPCDLIKEKLRKPTSHSTGSSSMMDFILGNADNF